jgi:hypothetical protein
VRALACKRRWFAAPLWARAPAEVQPRLAQARLGAERVGTPVRRWRSEKQDAFVRGIAAEFPEGPPRSGAHPFRRDVATPVVEADRRAQGKRRHSVRGLRASERQVWAAQRPPAPPRLPEAAGEPTRTPTAQAEAGRQAVGLDSCPAVRGILHDDPGGPRPPPGRRMAAAWGDVRASLQRNRAGEKGGQRMSAARGERATSTGA